VGPLLTGINFSKGYKVLMQIFFKASDSYGRLDFPVNSGNRGFCRAGLDPVPIIRRPQDAQ